MKMEDGLKSCGFIRLNEVKPISIQCRPDRVCEWNRCLHNFTAHLYGHIKNISIVLFRYYECVPRVCGSNIHKCENVFIFNTL